MAYLVEWNDPVGGHTEWYTSTLAAALEKADQLARDLIWKVRIMRLEDGKTWYW
jgi:hypothetical protein